MEEKLVLTTENNILIVIPSIPFPLRADGISVRYLPLIREFSRSHEIYLAIIQGELVDEERLKGIEPYCRKIVTITLPDPSNIPFMQKAFSRIVSLIPRTPPHLLIKHGGAMIGKTMAKELGNVSFNTMIWVTSSYTPYMDDVAHSLNPKTVVVDFIDSPSLWAQRELSGVGGSDYLKKYECWKMMEWEARLIRKTSSVIYISPVDASTVPEELAEKGKRFVVNNGINVESYDRRTIVEIPRPNMGFLGNMGYPPNVEAVKWLYEKVFLPLKKILPHLNLVVIGKNPENNLLELQREDGVYFTGQVDEIWPYVNSVDLFVFPIWMGTGIKNKVLEAMYAGKAVITTEVGNEGIDGASGRDMVICNNEDEFKEATLDLLEDVVKREKIGDSAHSYIKGKFDWSEKIGQFETILSDKQSNVTASREESSM